MSVQHILVIAFILCAAGGVLEKGLKNKLYRLFYATALVTFVWFWASAFLCVRTPEPGPTSLGIRWASVLVQSD